MFKNGNPWGQFETRPSRIYLTGFMGVGKSTLGPLLAGLLGWEFQDADRCIENVTGMSVSDWILIRGEAAFRQVESQVIREKSVALRQVMALGGGASLNPEFRSWIRSQGVLIYLKASPESLLARLQNSGSDRPLLQTPAFRTFEGQLNSEALASLLRRREPHYEDADFSVQTDDHKPAELAAAIQVWYLNRRIR